MEEKYYGILMNKVSMDGYVALYRPQCLIEGTIVEEEDEVGTYELFMDNNKSEYVLANDPESVMGDMVVAYPMTEADLLKRFGVDNLSDAKICFTDWVFENIHFGKAIYDEENEEIIGIDVASVSIGDFYDKIFYGATNEDGKISIPLEESAIILGISDFEKLLRIEDFESLRQVLGNIYKETNKVLAESQGKPHRRTPDEMNELFNDAYNSLIEIDNLEEMKKTLIAMEDVYLNYLVTLDDEEYNDKQLQEAIAFLYSYAERYEEMSKKNDLDEIKRELKTIIAEEREKFAEIIGKDVVTESDELTTIEEQKEENNNLASVRDVKAYFDQVIIGQDEAKKDVIAAIYMNKLGTDVSNKNNCLLVGPTGSGKTLIAETVAKYYDMPIEIIDTTQLTVPGYVGANIEDFLARLLDKTKGDLKKAENGIVVFDEIDKKGSSRNDDVSNRGVLNTLLPFMNGTVYNITYNRKTVYFDSSNLTIFATGAFTNANEEKSYGASKIGFNKDEKKVDIEYKKLNIDDFVNKADIPAELIGRFSVISQLSGHTIESLRKILTESKKSALLSEKEKLEKINIELRWTEGYLDKVVEKALELKTGARSLKSTVDKSIKEARWEVLSYLDIYSGIILTDKTVEDNHDCLLIDKEGNTHSLKDIIESKEKTNLVLVKK